MRLLWEDSSHPLRSTPKSQLTAKQPLMKMPEPTKKDILCPKTKKKPQ